MASAGFAKDAASELAFGCYGEPLLSFVALLGCLIFFGSGGYVGRWIGVGIAVGALSTSLAIIVRRRRK